ncbi:GNAT family N-acetyltransferase [Ruminococcus albus]|uniref:Acetyltransferase (GNAT) domain-containing protein n=1 Tax=Ruminococcus albus TaxID=1264 RepID=A0A1I1NEF7_RUMAL|nr:GNAT family N-acetyltransferase [Ruminococcus albus]SFC96009.1 Acetyltransferase (GNAT) domain-containing protein [Ruminococcus albus]
MIETNRLKIYAASQATMEAFIESQTIDVLKAAYTEMLNGCLAHPDQWEWYAIWMIELKDGTHIGELCFKGLSADGIAEIGYGISEGYQNKGYAAEAVKAVLDWAFAHTEVNAIEAETDPDNTASKRVLEKCGFVLKGVIGEEGPRWAVSKH